MFSTEKYDVLHICENDIPDIVKIYNSNKCFLINHIAKESISEQWVANEYQTMLQHNFSCCKIAEKESGYIVGFMDYKTAEETYLSLLMLHRDYKNSGIGSQIISRFETYIKNLGGKRIRIDVVIGYDETVLSFWKSKGFKHEKEIELTWDDNKLTAMKMVKTL